ncbi:hypothetical protein JG688_00014087, partial [Phytophthora aleatoria]
LLLGHIKRIFESTNGLAWSEPVAVFLEEIWHNARLRKHGHDAFLLQLFVYVSRPQVQHLSPLRRATDARIQEQLSRAAEYMRGCQIEGGVATTRYAASVKHDCRKMHQHLCRIILRSGSCSS